MILKPAYNTLHPLQAAAQDETRKVAKRLGRLGGGGGQEEEPPVKEPEVKEAPVKEAPVEKALGKESLVEKALGKESLVEEALGKESLEEEALGKESQVKEALEKQGQGEDVPKKVAPSRKRSSESVGSTGSKGGSKLLKASTTLKIAPTTAPAEGQGVKQLRARDALEELEGLVGEADMAGFKMPGEKWKQGNRLLLDSTGTMVSLVTRHVCESL